MRDSRVRLPLTYDVRLPDEAQADALRLLDASRSVVNQALTLLWPHLDLRVKPVSYTGAGSALLLLPTSSHARPIHSGKICYYPGWFGSAFLQSSQPKAVFLRLCG